MSDTIDQASRLRELVEYQDVASTEVEIETRPDKSPDSVETQASALIRLVNLHRTAFAPAQEAA